MHIDGLLRWLGGSRSRRRTLGGVLASALGLLARRPERDVAAHNPLKKCKKKKGKQKKKCVKKAKNHNAKHASEGGGGSAGGGTGGSAGSSLCAVPYTPDTEEQAVLGLINAHRRANGIGPLALQCQLGAAAEQHAQSMAVQNRMYHNPDVRAYLLLFGYVATSWGENIAAGQQTASQVFADWKQSRVHNENMLAAAFTEIGVGRAFSPISGWYWSTELGRR
jgi:uncharacterized protein YkwD